LVLAQSSTRSVSTIVGKATSSSIIKLLVAFFASIVALDIFISVLLRYFFAVRIPDSYDFCRLILPFRWHLQIARRCNLCRSAQ